jgi:hypothetical protein
MRNQYRFMNPPAPIRRVRLDNVALVPGNLLPQIKRWKKLAGELSNDELVIVLPNGDTKQRDTLTRVASLLRGHGHHARLIEEQELNPPRFGEVVQESLGI